MTAVFFPFRDCHEPMVSQAEIARFKTPAGRQRCGQVRPTHRRPCGELKRAVSGLRLAKLMKLLRSLHDLRPEPFSPIATSLCWN